MKNNLITIINFIIIVSILIILIFIPFYIQLNTELPEIINSCNKIEINKPLNEKLVSNFRFYFEEEDSIHKNKYFKPIYLLEVSCDLEIKNNIIISKKLSFI